MKVNPNYKTINVEAQEKDEKSILNFYKKMIRLRKRKMFSRTESMICFLKKTSKFMPIPVLEKITSMIVITNLSTKEAVCDLGKLEVSSTNLLLNNYEVEHEKENKLSLKPYEARVYRLK